MIIIIIITIIIIIRIAWQEIFCYANAVKQLSAFCFTEL